MCEIYGYRQLECVRDMDTDRVRECVRDTDIETKRECVRDMDILLRGRETV